PEPPQPEEAQRPPATSRQSPVPAPAVLPPMVLLRMVPQRLRPGPPPHGNAIPRDLHRPPRPRRRRDVRGFGSTAADAAEADSGAASGSGLDGRCTLATGAWTAASPGTSTGVTGSSS